MSACASCGKEIHSDDIGITKKLINRGTTTYFCKQCLAQQFKITVADIEKLIQNFREAGCSLFN